MIINCIAVDDEPLALNIIKEYVSKISFVNLVQTFDNAIEVIGFLKNNRIDLMFLDIRMEELTGIQLLNILQEKPKVILTTAYDSYAISSYELDVADYLLKPFSFERFFKAVNKSYELIMLEKGGGKKIETEVVQQEKLPKEEYFFVKTEFRLQKVNFNDILYIEGQGDYLSIVTLQGKIMTLQNFAKIETVLPSSRFIRVHKSYIISLNRVEKIERNRIKIGEKIIPISDSYKDKFFEELEKRKLM